MSSSPDFRVAEILKGAAAGSVAPAGFEIELRRAVPASRGPVAVPVEGGWRSATAGDLATEVREAARAEGYSAGWADGRRVAAAEARTRAAAVAGEVAASEHARRASHESAMAAVARAAGELERRVVPVAEEMAEAVLTAALVLAQAVLGRELAITTDGGADALRRALDLVPRLRPVTVRLNPADLATLAVHDSTAEFDGRQVTLVPDATLAPGDAVALCDATEIDARLGAALDRAAKALGL
ncbi:MAG TPA: FliH/SctL family protein [Mycobacteriales bacterium]|jgi:flagellar assembly protein FliH